MKFYLSFVMAVLLCVSAQGQTLKVKETFRGLTNPQILSDRLPEPQHFKDYVVDGKLRLGLRDAIQLVLENNTGIRVQQTQVQQAKYSLLGAHMPFDPILTAGFNANRTTSPTDSVLEGAETLGFLTHSGEINYSQTFQTGTNVVVGLNSTRNSTNSQFNFLNPSYSSGLSFGFAQPLLRNGWRFANQAQLVISRRGVQQSRATLEAQVSDIVLRIVGQYWDVVQARGTLDVQQKSLQAAEASYKRDKRALELGALPPLDIYRSESEVAARRVGVIQAEYMVKQAEDALRLSLGANIDSYFRVLDLDLTEHSTPEDTLRSSDIESALQLALRQRPEVEELRLALANDDTSIRLARNNMLPDLNLTGSYSSNGIGGNQYNLDANPPVLISSGGLGQSLNQVFGFGFPTYQMGLSLRFPIKNRNAEASLGNAFVSRRRNLLNERSLHEQITLEVSNAVHQLEQAKLSLEASRQSLDLSRKTLSAEQRKYELGDQEIFFVLQAQQQVAQAEATLLQAEVSYQVSLAALDHATGSLLEPFKIVVSEITK